MKPSILNTISVPDIATKSPGTVARAGDMPTRVAVNNVGANLIFVAHSENELSQIGNVSGVYQIQAGTERVFVLAPKQGLWVVGQGAGGRVSYAVSEAIPTTFMES